jgi:hypothetical protein
MNGHVWLITDNPAIVAGRNVEEVPSVQLDTAALVGKT